MIAMVTGTVARMDTLSAVVDAHGIGYRVFVSEKQLAAMSVGSAITLHTTLSVSPNTMEFTLFGFAYPEELDVFHMLTSVNGVGPRVAIAALGTLDVGSLARAVSANDTKSLTRVSGLGPKLAQRICLELGEKMSEYLFHKRVQSAESTDQPERNSAYEDVVEALVNLGYTRSDARRAAERAASLSEEKANAPALIKDALKLLSAGRL